MSWETVALVLGVLAAVVVGLREARLRRPVKVQKLVKGLSSRVSGIEEHLAGLPGEDFFTEIERRLAEAEERAGGSAPVALKALVDRVNVLSQDHTALKFAYDDLKARFTRLEQGTKWKNALSKEPSGG